MMADDVRYHRVNPTIWSQPWTNDAKLLALYLLTCDHRNTEGLFRLPSLYARADLQWSAERFDQAFAELLADGFIEWDPDASVVLIVNAMRVQSPANPNMVTAAVKQLALVPRSSLDARFGLLAERFCERLWQRLPERFREPPAPAPAPAPAEPTTSDADAPDPAEPDVSREARTLTRQFAEAALANGHSLPSKNSKARESWLVEMDRLLRLGPPGEGGHVPDPSEVDRVIRWCAADTGNGSYPGESVTVRSVPKFRERYSELRRKAGCGQPSRSDFEGGVPA